MTSGLLANPLERLVDSSEGPKVAALGGGHGLAVTLKAAQNYAADISAIVAIADDGGSSGRLTSGLGIPPPGDIRRCLLALSPDESLWSELFAYRFVGGDIEDHSLGNLLIAALNDITGDFGAAVDAAGRILKTVGRVIPAATQAAQLRAVASGREVVGQAEITKARDIEAISLGPADLRANPSALSAIADADQLILGPGSLFTSLMAVLLVPGVSEAWHASRAKKVFVLNLIDQDGETMGLTGTDHLRLLASVAGIGGPGLVIADSGDFDVPPGHSIVRVEPDEALVWGWDVAIEDSVDRTGGWPEHDAHRLSQRLRQVI